MRVCLIAGKAPSGTMQSEVEALGHTAGRIQLARCCSGELLLQELRQGHKAEVSIQALRAHFSLPEIRRKVGATTGAEPSARHRMCRSGGRRAPVLPPNDLMTCPVPA